jgi:hypothetical protein
MYEFDETFSDISSSSSTATFDFTELLDPEEPQLLSRSLSLEALPAIADEFFPPFDDIPPFPPNRHLLPMTSILPTAYPLKSTRCATVFLDSDDNLKTKVTLTLPPTPRMHNVSKEPRVIDTNVVCFIAASLTVGSYRCFREIKQ